MYRPFRCAPGAALPLLLAALPAFATEPLRDLAAFEHWAADSANCRADFLAALQDRAFLDALSRLGIVQTTPWQEGDLPEGELVAPRPIRIGGEPATRFKYWGDSGAEFYAIVAAPPETLAEALGATPVPPGLRKEFDERTLAVRGARAKKAGERLAPMVFVRRAETGDGSEVGCRRFDG